MTFAPLGQGVIFFGSAAKLPHASLFAVEYCPGYHACFTMHNLHCGPKTAHQTHGHNSVKSLKNILTILPLERLSSKFPVKWLLHLSFSVFIFLLR